MPGMSAKSTPPRRKKKVTAPKVDAEPPAEESEEEELSAEMLALMEQRSFNNPVNAGLASIVRGRVAAAQALRSHPRPLPPPPPHPPDRLSTAGAIAVPAGGTSRCASASSHLWRTEG